MQAILIFIIGSLAAGVAGLAWFWLFRRPNRHQPAPRLASDKIHRWDVHGGYRR